MILKFEIYRAYVFARRKKWHISLLLLLAYNTFVFFICERFSKTSKITIYSSHLKFILLWTNSSAVPFSSIGEGQTVFEQRKCKYTNCYVTDKKNLLDNITMFDAIAFAGPQFLETDDWPQFRSPHQKYAFVSIESAENYPICDPKFNNYFNWTWTYRLDSDSRWGYVVVRDINGTIIGPKKDMDWIKQEDMLPVTKDFKETLKNKTKFAAWFVSNCGNNARVQYIQHLRTILSKYNKTIDIYGKCGKLKCPRCAEVRCNEMLRRDYFFYMAFENSFSEDYVTEKLVRPLQYRTVPVVFGGANYSRFVPPGSYIRAHRIIDVKKVAKKMLKLYANFEKYVEYFRWTNHYSFHDKSESAETDDYCSICALLNNEEKVNQTSVYANFSSWWSPVCEDYDYFYKT